MMRIGSRPLFGIALLALCASGAGGQVTAMPPADSLPPGYAGSASCLDCHAKEHAVFAGTVKGRLLVGRPRDKHEALGCESCHGPGKAHEQSGGEELGQLITFSPRSKTSVKARDAVCLSCHEKTARVMWAGSVHETRDVACTSCHTLMHSVSDRANLRRETAPATCGRCHQQRVAQMLRASHMPVGEGKMDCTSCHNPHGSPNEKLLIASSVNEVCFACHAEKRGPFMWQHPPVIESCSNCHDPHGTAHEKLLKVPKPRLCQQCHDPTSHPTQPRGITAVDARFIQGRQCVDCHFNIHGSNHPSGKYFTR
jgi:DmsE family decaheme c-type cytochrome